MVSMAYAYVDGELGGANEGMGRRRCHTRADADVVEAAGTGHRMRIHGSACGCGPRSIGGVAYTKETEAQTEGLAASAHVCSSLAR